MKCKIDGCCNKAIDGRPHGMCRKHYEISLHGCVKKRIYPKSDKACCIEGCKNIALSAYNHGMCSKHYLQVLSCGETFQTEYERKQERNAEIVQLLKGGMPRAEIRKMYGISRDSLKWIVDQSGDDSLKIDQALTYDQISAKLTENGTLLRYAGEYKRGEYITLSCDTCGSVMRYSSSALFKKHIGCKECKRREQEQRLQLAEKEKADNADSREQARADAEKQKEMQHEARRREIVCPVCGETFVTYKARQVVCSSECGRKRANIRHTRRKDTRISKDKRIDKISLDVLFRRDSGVCHICGKQCDWNDCTQTGTAFIAGNLYPSVDHIIPVSKGGADQWSNVRLAHRICNSKRGNNLPLSWLK